MDIRHRHHDRRGLSLLELVVVIAIILLLAISVFWIGSKVRSLVVALEPDGVKRVEGGSEKPDDKPPAEPDQQVPGEKKETPPK